MEAWGARTINNTLIAGLQLIRRTTDVQFIWQTGKIYHQQVTEAVKAAGEIPNLFVTDFIKDMAAAYAAADLVIFDPEECWKPGDYASKSCNTPFTGQELFGKIKYTICGGKTVYSDK